MASQLPPAPNVLTSTTFPVQTIATSDLPFPHRISSTHLGDDLRKGDEEEARTARADLLQPLDRAEVLAQVVAVLLRHEAEDGEDDEAGKDGGGRVGQADDPGVAVDVVLELVVGGEGHEPAERHADGHEDLEGQNSTEHTRTSHILRLLAW